MELLDLNQDVLLRILVYCDIPSVVFVSQTCKQLHSLATEKHLWISLIQSHALVIDSPYDRPLCDCSIVDLVDIAKRAIWGSESWSPSSKSEPVVYRQHIAHISNETDTRTPILLSSGRYLFSRGAHSVDCWDIIEDRHIWKYRCESIDSYILDFATHVTEDGKVAAILIGEHLGVPNPNIGGSVTIFRLDLLTGTWCSLYNFDVPWSPPGHFQVEMCEDTAVIINPSQWIILVNWKLQACILSTIPQTFYPNELLAFDISLISGYIICAFQQHYDQEDIQLCVWTMDLLDKYWCPTHSVDDLEAIQIIEDIPCSSSDSFRPPSCLTLEFSICKHPFRDDVYKIWVLSHPVDLFERDRIPGHVCHYSLILDPSDSPALHHKSSFTVDSAIDWYPKVTLRRELLWDNTVSYAGHRQVSRRVTGADGQATNVHQLFSLEDNDGVDLQLPSSIGQIGLFPYSGALFYDDYTHGTLVINFYK